jgi:peptide/nickel transport system permease protein
MLGGVVVLLFVVAALAGLALTRGAHPRLDPRTVRLPDKLRPPLARLEAGGPAAAPAGAGRALLGTDELGRDLLARMLEGARVSLTVGVVAVGLAVGIGCLLGGLAGHYGRVRLPAPAAGLAAAGLAVLLAVGVALARGAALRDVLAWALIGGLLAATGLAGWLRRRPLELTVDGLVTGLIDVMLCIPTFFLILTVIAVLRPSI